MDQLPIPIWQEILRHLNITDVIALSQTSRALSVIVNDNSVWQELCERDFGDIQVLKAILESAGITGLKDRTVVTSSWKAEYRRKFEVRAAADFDQLNKLYHQAEEALESLNEESPESLVGEIGDSLLDIVDTFAGYAPAYYSLAFLCFMANEYEPALEFIELGLGVDNELESLITLKAQVEQKMAEIEGEEDDEPLLDGKVLTPAVKTVLREIFVRFDKDKDGGWNMAELESFIFATNGVHPTPKVLKQMLKNYPTFPNGNLRVEGLFEFFRRQTLEDPEETRKDLLTHGYDRALKKINDIPPVA